MSLCEKRKEGKEKFDTHKSASPEPSCVSMKSEASMGVPPALSDTAMTSDLDTICKMNICVKNEEEVKTASMGVPPALSDGAMTSDLEVRRGCVSRSGNTDLQRVKDQHKTSMKRKYESLFEGIKPQENQTLLNRLYTQLYIIEGEGEGVNEEHEVLQMEKKPRTQDTPISCNEIFKPLHQPVHAEKYKIKTVLTKGIAGIGKTVSVQKFILDWSEGKANQDVDFMFVLPFRELNMIKDHKYSLHRLLLDFHPELQDLDSKLYEKCKVVFIFDGLDESRVILHMFSDDEKVSDMNESSSVGVLMSKLIRGDLLPSAHIWITSRPAAANQIPSKYINRLTEIQGFNDPQKEEYFRKRINDENQASRIISHIRRSRSLHIMCHIPVFCWISATVLQNLLKQGDSAEIPQTLTEMYIHFLLTQINMRNQKYEERDPEKLQKSHRDVIVKLAELAFKQLMKGNVMFYEEDLIESGIDITDASVYSGICTEIFKEESVIHQRKVYCFIHLSFQEFLAALYLFYCHLVKNEKSLKLFESKLYTRCSQKDSLYELLTEAVNKSSQSKNGHLDLFLRFLLGVSLESNQKLLLDFLKHTVDSSETIQIITIYIKDTIKHQSGVVHRNNEEKYEKRDDRNNSLETIKSVSQHYKNKFRGSFNLDNDESDDDNDSDDDDSDDSDDDDSDDDDSDYYYGEDDKLFIRDYISDEKRNKVTVEGLSADRCINLFLCLLEMNDQTLYREIQEFVKSENHSVNLSPSHCSTIAYMLQISEEELDEFDLKKYNTSDVGRMRLIPAVVNCRKALLAGCNLTGQSCESLSSCLQSSNSLRELDLSHNDLQDSGVKLLSDGLKSSHCQLNTLRLMFCRLTDQCCESLSLFLQSNISLRELDLSNNHLQDSGVKLLSKGLKSSHCQLNTLRLEGCNLTGQSCESLSSCLQSSNSLREMDLSHNDLQDSGVKLLSDGLKSSHCQLNILRLTACMVTEEGCRFLASALSSNPSHLRELDLSYNHPEQSLFKLLSDPNYRLEKLNVDHGGEIRITTGPRKYACALTLDPNTANAFLILSERNRKVILVKEEQLYPDHPERFDGHHPQVLCRKSLSGRCYWEAEWSGEVVNISATYKGINRTGWKDDCWFGLNGKSWTLTCSNNKFSAKHNKKTIDISVPPCPNRVGVYLNWSAGSLSFYSVSDTHTLTHLHTFNSRFTEPLYAGFTFYCVNSSVSLCEM